MASASFSSPSHQALTNNHQQQQGQRSNQTPRVGGQNNNDERVPGMQYCGMTCNPGRQPYLLFPPEPTGVRPPKSDITQYQDPVDRALNKPHANGKSTTCRPDNTKNTVPTPLPARYWACCQTDCEERGVNTEYNTYCLLCEHPRCGYCPAVNDRNFAQARQPWNSRQ